MSVYTHVNTHVFIRVHTDIFYIGIHLHDLNTTLQSKLGAATTLLLCTIRQLVYPPCIHWETPAYSRQACARRSGAFCKRQHLLRGSLAPQADMTWIAICFCFKNEVVSKLDRRAQTVHEIEFAKAAVVKGLINGCRPVHTAVLLVVRHSAVRPQLEVLKCIANEGDPNGQRRQREPSVVENTLAYTVN